MDTTGPCPDARATALADYERRFRRADLPLLSEDFSARSDVFNRAFPLLMLTDDRYREEFLDEITGQLRETFAARAEYLALRAGAGG